VSTQYTVAKNHSKYIYCSNLPLNKPSSSLQKAQARRADTEEEGEDEDDNKAQEAQELLDQINEEMAGNNNRLTDPKVLQFYKEKLHSMPCQNQGFVLDGFPYIYCSNLPLNQPSSSFSTWSFNFGKPSKTNPWF
jgi:hypothetical protein